MKRERIEELRGKLAAVKAVPPMSVSFSPELEECLDAIEQRDDEIRIQQGIIAGQDATIEMLREQAMGEDL